MTMYTKGQQVKVIEGSIAISIDSSYSECVLGGLKNGTIIMVVTSKEAPWKKKTKNSQQP